MKGERNKQAQTYPCPSGSSLVLSVATAFPASPSKLEGEGRPYLQIIVYIWSTLAGATQTSLWLFHNSEHIAVELYTVLIKATSRLHNLHTHPNLGQEMLTEDTRETA